MSANLSWLTPGTGTVTSYGAPMSEADLEAFERAWQAAMDAHNAHFLPFRAAVGQRWHCPRCLRELHSATHRRLHARGKKPRCRT